MKAGHTQVDGGYQVPGGPHPCMNTPVCTCMHVCMSEEHVCDTWGVAQFSHDWTEILEASTAKIWAQNVS